MKNLSINLITLILIIMVIISGCSPSSTSRNEESSSEDSYEALLFVNGEELQSIGETAEELGVSPKDLIGTIEDKINIEVRPKVELHSNYLEVGTEIYSVDVNPDIVLARKDNGEYEVFE